MCDGPSFLRRPRKSSEDYWEFVNLAGEIDVFDVAKAGYPWFGRRIEGPDGVVCCDREDELLYRTSDGRYVLVYWDDSSLGGPPKPWPERELSPEDASLWLMLNQHEVPAPLKPVPIRDPSEDPSSRLNLEWTPEDPGADKTFSGSNGPERKADEPDKFYDESGINYEKLGDDLLRHRKLRSAKLLQRMKRHRNLTISFNEVITSVYDDKFVSGDAIRTLVNRTNNLLVERHVPLRFRTAGDHVIKETLPG